jgi:hypothetical protein
MIVAWALSTRLVVDDSSRLGTSGRVLNDSVLGDGVGGSVVSSLSAEHALLDSWAGGGTGVRSVVGGVLLSVGVIDGSGALGELSRLELEDREIFSGKKEEVDEEEDRLGENIEDTIENHLRIGGDV